MQTVQQKIISNKLGLLSLAEELQNVSKACKIMGYSRDTFYRYKELKDDGGIESLHEKTRKKPNYKNRVDGIVESSVLKMAIDFPAFGQKRAANELRKNGIFLSPAGVRCIWVRPNLDPYPKKYTLT